MDFPWPDIRQITVAILIMLRVSALIILLPVLGHQLIPAQIKVGLIFFLTLLLYPIVQSHVTAIPLQPFAFAAIAIQEILIAAAMALFAQLIFAAAQFAGQIISFQMGMTVANVFDPVTHSQQPVISILAMALSMLLWVSSGAHHLFLYALFDSFTLFPIGQSWSFAGIGMLNEATSQMFVLSLKLAAPIMLLLTMIYVALGLLSRAVPQIQVFFVSFPITVGLGLLTFGMGMPAFIYLLSDAFSSLSIQVPYFLRHLVGV